MRKFYISHYALFLLLLLTTQSVFSQANIKVKVLSVSVGNNVDCDGFLSGNSDFAFEYGALDNTLGLGNNSPAAFGLTGDFNFSNKNNDNGPWSLTVNNTFFDHDYICPSDVPTQLTINWQGYENDAPLFDWDLLGTLSEVRTGVQSPTVNVPVTTGFSGTITFTANGTSSCGTQAYTIQVEIIRTDLSILIMEDNICSALQVPADNATHTYAYCGNYTIENGEPIFQSIGDAGHGSAWFYFTLPSNSSGNIRIDTDFPETNFGTEIALYHAADGYGCLQGTNNFNNLQIKRKFNYLSEHSFADDDIPIIAPEGKATGNWNGGLISEGAPLIPGETYYIQFNTDGANQKGSVGIKITDLGGTPTTFNDIPCTSVQLSGIVPGTIVSSDNTNASSPNLTLSYADATDREAGYAWNGTDNADYVAYIYAPPTGTSNSINDNVWFHFNAPNSGRIYFEGEVTGLFGISEAEDIALYGLDPRFAPGQPSDLFCSNLSELAAAAGSVSGSSRTAKISAQCLEPGYTYYGTLDPQTVSTVSSGKIYIYDPSVEDPTNNPPGNDILCLSMLDTLYEVPVILGGQNPTFQAVAGTNKYACREYLAGEPSSNTDPANRADQTVWHYFIAPPSGAIEMSIRAYIGLDTLRYNVYELLNGTNCYGGLGPATYTQDGTQQTPIITPIISGTAGFTGVQTSACCLDPGKIYAVQIDGGHPGDEGEYIIEYIREVDSDAGDIFATMANGDTVKVTVPDTAFVCFGDNLTPGILLNGIGESTADLPGCLRAGYILHSYPTIPTTISGITYIDSIQSLTGILTNNGTGDGSFGNPAFNQVYYLSPAGDLPADWGQFSCLSSTVEQGLPVVFLRPLTTNVSYDNTNCTATFSVNGGYGAYANQPYPYTITDPLGTVTFTGTLAANTPTNFQGSIAGIYIVTVNDGSCPVTFTFDASNCNNPCVPSTNNVAKTICQGESILLAGQLQTQAGTYTDHFTTPEGCDSTVITTLSILPTFASTTQHNLCPGGSITVAGHTYSSQGVYVDTLQAVNGCDSVVTSVVFILPEVVTNLQATICQGGSYAFNGNNYTTEGVYTKTLTTSAGCDSIVKLSLFVTAPSTSYISATICDDATYDFHGTSLNASGVYKDTVSTASGCDSIVVLELTVENCDFIISNVVTPNNDGQNDTWKVSDYTVIQGCTVTIYNRWGQPVYETNDYHNEWAGTKNGEQLPDGVYFYAIKCGDDKQYTGSINLLRFKK